MVSRAFNDRCILLHPLLHEQSVAYEARLDLCGRQEAQYVLVSTNDAMRGKSYVNRSIDLARSIARSSETWSS